MLAMLKRAFPAHLFKKMALACCLAAITGQWPWLDAVIIGALVGWYAFEPPKPSRGAIELCRIYHNIACTFGPEETVRAMRDHAIDAYCKNERRG